MDSDSGDSARQSRGRVVVLVDNDVRGDSRVQEQAQAGSAAGWHVVLLGHSADTAETFRLGNVEIRLIKRSTLLEKRRRAFRRSWLRWPLAYPPTGIGEYKAQWIRAVQADLRTRRDELTVRAAAGERGWNLRLRRALIGIQAVGPAMRRPWVSMRNWQLDRLRNAPRFRGPLDWLAMVFWPLVRGDESWRRLEPALWEYEAFAQVIHELRPDIIHAHGARTIGVAARAAILAKADGRPVKLVWETDTFLPSARSEFDTARAHRAHIAHEREYVPFADAVIANTPVLAQRLRTHHRLTDSPIVVPDEVAAGVVTQREPEAGWHPTRVDGAGQIDDVYSRLLPDHAGSAVVEARPQSWVDGSMTADVIP